MASVTRSHDVPVFPTKLRFLLDNTVSAEVRFAVRDALAPYRALGIEVTEEEIEMPFNCYERHREQYNGVSTLEYFVPNAFIGKAFNSSSYEGTRDIDISDLGECFEVQGPYLIAEGNRKDVPHELRSSVLWQQEQTTEIVHMINISYSVEKCTSDTFNRGEASSNPAADQDSMAREVALVERPCLFVEGHRTELPHDRRPTALAHQTQMADVVHQVCVGYSVNSSFSKKLATIDPAMALITEQNCLPTFPLKEVAVVLTARDVFAAHMAYVFCLARQGYGCLINCFRLQNDPSITAKECVHGLGHAFGLHHCALPCVMTFSKTAQDARDKSAEFCDKCSQHLQRFVKLRDEQTQQQQQQQQEHTQQQQQQSPHFTSSLQPPHQQSQ